MTAAAVAEADRPVTTGSRLAAVLRMNLVDSRNRVGMPWVILAAIFAINLAVFWAVQAGTGSPDGGVTGALAAMFFIVGTQYLVTMTQVMPFALSLGITRRHFYTGVLSLLAVETLLHSVLLTVLLGIERATGGWGVGMQFFAVGFLSGQNVVLTVLCYWVPMFVVGAVFLLSGAVFRRWGQLGVWALGVGVGLVAGLAVVLVTLQQAWPAVGRFFTGTPVPLLLAGYPLVVGVLVVGGYLVVRRARV
ncbi:hypothetical protein [Pseudonocardia sp. ICBG1293]|uniref:hypothetical protein n=1 Tax=Pseudonocardia sp. ICBG1293 TaxID=2844382 RepID=UPI001CCA1D50|nr:hypothetical protein [Pseudonocardia sp. ICBG1293]